MDSEQYDILSNLLNQFTDKAREYGYTNFDEVLEALREYEREDPRRFCDYCMCHIYDRKFDICSKCNKSYHVHCFDKHYD